MEMDRRIVRMSRNWLWMLATPFLLLVLAFPGSVAVAQVSTPAAEDEPLYVDPNNRFAIPIPTNWVAEEQDGFVVISTSDGKISISAGIVDAPGATSGIDLFMRLLDPEFDNTALAELLATPATGSDDTALYTFDDGAESGQLVQALGRRAGDDVFVLVLRGELEAVKLRQVQVDKIFEGTLIRIEGDATPVASPPA
jgi:hypothetical protein